ncbi:MAG: flap endonuclease-1 [Candidatus Heimdallarchaeaceae archaeon]
MGVKKISDLIKGEPIELSDLSRKRLAIDAYNILYQFLASIRGMDGSLLKNIDGMITSHLSGLLYRNARLLQHGIKLVYVFDGKPSELKKEEIRRRVKLKEKARKELEEARERGDMERVRTVAQRTVSLTEDMLKDAKHLLKLMGIPYIEAPQEGEAQAAYLAQNRKVWGVASQDFDSLLFGAPILIRNLTLSGRRKLPRTNRYITVNVEIYRRENLLKELNLTPDQLIDMAILIGTDFNPDGVKGVGPKTAYKYIQQYGSIEKVLENVNIKLNADYEEIREVFRKPVITEDYNLSFGEIDIEGIVEFLCEQRGFDEARVRNVLSKTKEEQKSILQQRRLDSFFS